MWALALVLATMSPAEGHKADPAPVVTHNAVDEGFVASNRVAGRLLDSLVELRELVVEVEREPDTFLVPGEPAEMSAKARLTIYNPFDSPIRDVEADVVLLTSRELEFAWNRIYLPPLQLTPEIAAQPMPAPMVELGFSEEEVVLPPLEQRRVEVSDEFAAIPPTKHNPAAYLAGVATYTLLDPTTEDLLKILDHGGPSDLGAVANWASRMASEGITPLDDSGRGRVVDRVIRGITELRAPPAHGDFQRISAYTTLIHACARPPDLERLLALNRPISILLASAVVSYDAAVVEEDTLGVSIHGFRRLHAPAEPSIAWEAAMGRLRMLGLDRLIRLAFDPIDFRSAPEGRFKRSPRHSQAVELLSPVAPVQVARVLAIADERTDVQRDVLRFYIAVRHAAAVEPLVEWIVDHPTEVEDVGIEAVKVMGEHMLPVLLRRYLDVDSSPSERLAMRRLLGQLPAIHVPLLTELSRSLGVDLDESQRPFDVPKLLTMIERYDQSLVHGRIEELVRRIEADGVDRAALRLRLRAIKQLAEVAPNRLVELAQEVIDLHVLAVRDFAADSATERRSILRQLLELPLGEFNGKAATAAALVSAEVAVRAGLYVQAADILVEHDRDLVDPEVRAAYAGALQRELAVQMEAGAWDAADAVLNRAEMNVWDLIDVPVLRRRVKWMRNRPLIAVGGVVLVALLSLGGFAAHRAGWFGRSRRPEGEGEGEAEGELDGDGELDGSAASEDAERSRAGQSEVGQSEASQSGASESDVMGSAKSSDDNFAA